MDRQLDYDNLQTEEDFQKVYKFLLTKRQKLTPQELVLFNFVIFELCLWDEVKASMSELAILDQKGVLMGLDRAKYLFILATTERFQGHMTKALAIAKEAETLSLNENGNRIKYQLGGFIALCLMETGKIFLAIDRLHEVLAIPALKAYDKGMLLAYETTFLSHLGQNQAIARSLEQIIENERDVFELYLEMVDGNLTLTRKWIKLGWPPELTRYMGVKFLTLLMQSVIVLGNEQDLMDVKRSWIPEYLERLKKSNPQVEYIEKFQAILGLIAYEDLRENIEHESWKINIDNCFTDTLVAVKRGQRPLALEIIENKIRPICRKNHLMSSLYPIYQNGMWLPESGWSHAYNHFIGQLEERHREPRLLVYYDKIVYESGEAPVEMDFRRSPGSLKLLQVLAGHAGNSFSKQELHEQLSDSEYHPFMHDPRLLKALKRLEKKIVDKGIPSPWYLPRDNRIVLSLKIEVR
ncbi:MAG: hypothetical protein A2X86_11030 [Bdellovibrionales bacterium GWA2_49_15]|nr:MAG: hypothetical protein A2X86_11030 [Bdellovibrionales bacterium GWA2_49_15]HAZ12718.1 hypothetical protein [Bdellovibrionales bacterium]